jgi:arylsulfatase A-like enzyme
VATILTGVHKASHGVVRNKSLLPEVAVTAAELFRYQGVATAGIIANPVVGPEVGFGQGFDAFGFPPGFVTEGPGRFGGEPVADAAIETLAAWAESGERFFLWLHFMDPHGAYLPPEEFIGSFSEEDYEPSVPEAIPLVDANHGLGILPRYQALDGQEYDQLIPVNDLRARYDAEIRFVDHQIGRVLGALRQLDLWDATAVVLTADHGESLGEHEYFFQHGWHLYDGSVRVPLLIRLPGGHQGVRVANAVSTLDVAPSVLEIGGLAVPEFMEGSSLRPCIDSAGDRAAFSQTMYGNNLASLTEGGFKLIFTPAPPDPSEDDRFPDGWKDYWPTEAAFELYDLAADPREGRNLATVEVDRFQAMQAKLAAWLADQHQRRTALADILRNDEHYKESVGMLERDDRLEEQLRALGYVE